MTGLHWLFIAPCVLAAGALAAAARGGSRWAAATDALSNELDAARRPSTEARYDVRQLEGLPRPVQRYFRSVLQDGQRIVAAATIAQRGTFNLGTTDERWKPFEARQRITTRRPGFVWDARVRLAPLIDIRVRDAYVAGIGILKASASGLHSLADVRGDGDIARGELMRYFAEAAWYPTALLPSQGVRWEAVDEHAADATLLDEGISVTMRVAFDDEGLIASARFPFRGAMVDGVSVQRPWEGRWSGVTIRDGMRVPSSGEAAWFTPDGRKPYWRGDVTSLTYEFAA